MLRLRMPSSNNVETMFVQHYSEKGAEWKPQLLNYEQYKSRRQGSRNCSMTSSIIKLAWKPQLLSDEQYN